PPLHWRRMASFFRRKKDKDAAAGKPGETRKGGLDIEALAAAFPKPRDAAGGGEDNRAGTDAGAGNESSADHARASTARAAATAPGAPDAGAGAAAAVLDAPAAAVSAAPAPPAAPVVVTPPPSADTQDKPAAAPGKPGW